ncbi:MAG TPA: COX15/CtaA family protein, partial [Actinomycetota bacterium]|nr:COX15/CtaA family protein [Actinomycetota bacterium]
SLEQRAQVIEFSHRAVAGLVIVLIGSLAVWAFLRYRDQPRVLWPSVTAFGLVLFQAILGAIVVKLELEALSVVLHLATALSLLALLIYLDVGLYGRVAVDAPAIRRRARVAAGSVFVLLLVGSYVSGSNAGYVFSDWPLMNGKVIPDLQVEPQAIHFLHRALAAVVGVILFAAITKIVRSTDRPAVARLAQTAGALFLVEILVGAANVWTHLNAAFVTLHLAVGASIWACLVGIAFLASPVAERAADPAMSRAPLPEAS